MKSKFAFKFGDIIHKYLAKMLVSIPTQNGSSMGFACDIVRSDIPLLTGLDVIRREELIINIGNLELEYNDWILPMKIKNNHLIISWLSNIHYSKTQLKKLHRHIRQPSAENYTDY